MFADRFLTLLRTQRAFVAWPAQPCCAAARPAAGLTVLVADESAAHADFVRQLRDAQDADSRFDLIHLARRRRTASTNTWPAPRRPASRWRSA